MVCIFAVTILSLFTTAPSPGLKLAVEVVVLLVQAPTKNSTATSVILTAIGKNFFIFSLIVIILRK
jgi:hypothetical protein